MFQKSLFVVLLFACVHRIQSVSVPFIHKCKAEDSKCLKESTQFAIPMFAAGLPEFGIESLDPLHIKHLDASSPSLKLILKDITGTGLSQCVSKKIKFNEDKSKILVKLLCNVEFRALYEMDGSLLIIPMKGNGDAYLLLKQILITVEAGLGETKGEDGAKHWSIKDWVHTYELKEKATIELENLFNGNEALGRAAKELLATSANEVINEVGPPVVKEVLASVIERVGKFFQMIPIDNLIE